MTIVATVDRRSTNPIGEWKSYPLDVDGVIRNRTDGGDYVIMRNDMITPDGWESKISTIPDNLDIVFLSESPTSLAAPRRLAEGIYTADFCGCIYAMYISGNYQRKLVRYEDPISKIKTDIHMGVINAGRFYPQIVFCNPNTFHSTSQKELRGLSSLDARQVYTGYVSLIIAIILAIVLCYCLFYIATMKKEDR